MFSCFLVLPYPFTTFSSTAGINPIGYSPSPAFRLCRPLLSQATAARGVKQRSGHSSTVAETFDLELKANFIGFCSGIIDLKAKQKPGACYGLASEHFKLSR